MEDKLSQLIGLLELLVTRSFDDRNRLGSDLTEAMERFERDLPLTTGQVARLLDVSERTVKRLVRPAGRSKRGGMVWYSRQEVDAIWRAPASGGEKRGTGSRHQPGGRSRSSTAASAAGSLTSSCPDKVGFDNPLVSAVEKRLREGAANKSNESLGAKLRLIPRVSPESPRK
jgi:hypothetical protein